MTYYWAGADPGRRRCFGLAFLAETDSLSCTTVSSVDMAAQKIIRVGSFLGPGIDTPMWWSSSEGGGRKAEESLRRKHSIRAATANLANELQGTSIVGGVMMTYKVREWFYEAPITESNAKALLAAYGFDQAEFAKKLKFPRTWRNEHERNAPIAAVCAREGCSKMWLTILAKIRHYSKQKTE